MESYDHKKIEKKWQKEWEKKKIYKTLNSGKKYYVLDMFPYPSGAGLHVGHPRGYIGSDVFARMKRMAGFNVLHPMGYDAFGLPAEQYAIEHKIHPRLAVEKNIKTFRGQLDKIGFSYDWSRQVNTTDPAYYKWTQWIFLQIYESWYDNAKKRARPISELIKIFEKKGNIGLNAVSDSNVGQFSALLWKRMNDLERQAVLMKYRLAYEGYASVNWCPKLGTVLANDEVVDGPHGEPVSERGGYPVEKKQMRQWFMRITAYADRLLGGLDTLNWSEHIKEIQRNWIGKSEGAIINFPLKTKANFVLLHGFEGSPQANFFPWVRKNLEKNGFTVSVPTLPNTNKPVVMDQVHSVLKTETFNEDTVLFGHSLGTTVALKVVENLKTPIAKLVLASAFMSPRIADRPYVKTFDWKFDFEKIKKNVKEIVILRDLTDEIPPEYPEEIQRALGASMIDVVAKDWHFSTAEEPAILENLLPQVRVFTTRADTLFGATYVVLAPEHPMLEKLKSHISNWAAVEEYQKNTKKKDEVVRTAVDKEKTGVKLSGISACNPATGQEIPVWVADYVLPNYGTGAVMAVPAHDERDFQFAKKYNLSIREVVRPYVIDQVNTPHPDKPFAVRRNIHAIVFDPIKKKYLIIRNPKFGWDTVVIGGVEEGEDLVTAALREIKEETGYTDLVFKRFLGDPVQAAYFAKHKNENRMAIASALYFELASDARIEIPTDGENDGNEIMWIESRDFVPGKMINSELPFWLERLHGGEHAYSGDGILVNSGIFDGKNNREVMRGIIESVGGTSVTQYKMRDAIFARQRYWGEPIPLSHTSNGIITPLKEKNLPLKLPNVKSYEPTGTGESPLSGVKEWAKKGYETNTMPGWAGSSWYFLRYMDPKNTKAFANKKSLTYWKNVDMYVGGQEHATGHLLYARFWHKVLHDLGFVPTDEPFQTLRNQGIILASDGRKMSKRWGNVINPDDIVASYGADTLRLYEMFMGPFDQSLPWSTESIIGCRRFIEKVWRLSSKITKDTVGQSSIEKILHKTIKKVTEDIGGFSFNTAVSAMMICVNEMEKVDTITRSQFKVFLQLLAPFAPHVTEELWKTLGEKRCIHHSKWPLYDSKKIEDEIVTIAVQINGKVRTEIVIPRTLSPKDAETYILNDPKVQTLLVGKSIKRFIFVPGRLANIVL